MADRLKFIILSGIGVLLFLFPIELDGKITVGFAAIADAAIALLADQMPAIAVTLVVMSAVISLFVVIARPKAILDRPGIGALFNVGPVWLGVRLLGALFGVMTLFELGPEWVHGDATGGTILYQLAAIIVAYFLIAALLLPFLTAFGLMEFIGALARPFFRRVFTLPGRSSIDAVASWLGSGPVGVLITIEQFEAGFYTERESAVIATNFSVVSIAFCIVIINFVDLGHLFPQFYLTVCVAGLVAAVITPRLLPLSAKADRYYSPAGKQIAEEVPQGRSALSWGFAEAVARAGNAPRPAAIARHAMINVFDIWFGLLPAVFAIGTVSLILVEHTPIFNYLAYPFEFVLKILRIPDAALAAPAMLIGFADQFLPAIVARDLPSEMTRFVVAGISVTQLIYMSEVGTLLLKSKIPLGLGELFMIFLLRTLITLPIVALAAHILF